MGTRKGRVNLEWAQMDPRSALDRKGLTVLREGRGSGLLGPLGRRSLCPKGVFEEVLPIFLFEKQNKRVVLAGSREEEVKLGNLSGCG